MQQTLTARPVPYYRGPSEAAFGLEPVTTEGNASRGSMRLGPWAHQQDGLAIHQGSAGVLVDDVTAYAALTGRAENQWGVTSAISVDFHAAIPPDTPRLISTAALDHRSAAWGHSSGRVTTEAGELVATIGQRMRYIPGDSSVHEKPGEPENATPWLTSMDSLITPTAQQENRSEFQLNAAPEMKNPLGMLHGGVGLALCELAARTAWAPDGESSAARFQTSSIRLSYLRPGNLEEDLRLVVDILHASRSVVLAEVRIQNASGETATFSLNTLHRSTPDQ